MLHCWRKITGNEFLWVDNPDLSQEKHLPPSLYPDFFLPPFLPSSLSTFISFSNSSQATARGQNTILVSHMGGRCPGHFETPLVALPGTLARRWIRSGCAGFELVFQHRKLVLHQFSMPCHSVGPWWAPDQTRKEASTRHYPDLWSVIQQKQISHNSTQGCLC